ncbi:MAG: PAS domain S-box protein [Candidatus Cloacimonetes bacterium]|nr:PAS domain S-box protein [Candidatus Cloacimonadota bacterium]
MGTLDITILYVEDEILILNSVSMILEKRVKRVYSAVNGEEGLKLFEKYRPDVVIVDIIIPKMDGLMLARRIKEIDPSTVIIVLSAFDKKENLLEAINIGIDRFLQKPLNYDHLLKIINELHSTKILEGRVEKEKAARQMVEVELAKTEKKYQDLYDNAPDMYFSVSPEGNVTDVNQFGAEYLGYTKEELIGKAVWMVVYHDDLKDVKKQVSEIFKKKEEFSELEFRKVAKDGSVFHVHERTQLIFDENGIPSEIRIICRDITDRQRIQHALKESEERYRLAVEQTGQVVFDADYSNQNIEVVGAVKEMFGYTSDEFTDFLSFNNAVLLIHPDDKDDTLSAINKAAKTSRRFQIECRLQKQDKDYLYAYVNGVCLIDESGKVARILGSVEDITLRKENEAKLQEMHEYVRNLIESSLTMFISVDNDRKIVEFNSAAEKNFGYNKKEVIGEHVKLLYADADECVRIGKLIQENGTFYGVVRNKRKNGEEFVSYLSSALMQDAQGNQIGSVGNSIDISESQEREKALRMKEELYRTLVKTSQNGFSILDLEGNIVFCNKYKAEMFGYEDPKELVGKQIIELVAPDDRDKAARKLRNLLESDSDIVHIELNLLRRDGSIFPGYFCASIIHDDEGNPIQIMDTMTEVSERVKKEDTLNEKREWHKELLNNLPVAIQEFDKSGVITFANNLASLLFEYTIEELLGTNIGKLYNSETEDSFSINSYFADILHKKPKPSVWKGLLKKKSGEEVCVSMAWTYKMDEHDRIVGFVGVVYER